MMNQTNLGTLHTARRVRRVAVPRGWRLRIDGGKHCCRGRGTAKRAVLTSTLRDVSEDVREVGLLWAYGHHAGGVVERVT